MSGKRPDEDVARLRPMGYVVEPRPIGQGSYAVVKSAVHTTYGKVAIKVVDRSHKAPKDFLNKFFPREIEILSKIKHENIVKIIKIFEASRKTYIIMELAVNGDLLEYIRARTRLHEHRAKFFFRQLIEAVHYLHENDIMHRDLKCENILLDQYFNVKVTDFGFGRILLPGESSTTFCGSPAYAAPEILRAESYTGFAHDWWSVGVILFIMICGKFPFEDEDYKEEVKEQMSHRIKYPTFMKHRPSSEVKNVVHCLLQPDIQKRYDYHDCIKDVWLKEMPHFILKNDADSHLVMQGNAAAVIQKMNEDDGLKVDAPEPKSDDDEQSSVATSSSCGPKKLPRFWKFMHLFKRDKSDK